ncbi:hypothetical protein [Metamycoplasma buccale]|uniref:hypothetical protein n=1 Tax=Metamycoplasma buccale TaxID=55602 RepID=UPI00398E5ECF
MKNIKKNLVVGMIFSFLAFIISSLYFAFVVFYNNLATSFVHSMKFVFKKYLEISIFLVLLQVSIPIIAFINCIYIFKEKLNKTLKFISILNVVLAFLPFINSASSLMLLSFTSRYLKISNIRNNIKNNENMLNKFNEDNEIDIKNDFNQNAL